MPAKQHRRKPTKEDLAPSVSLLHDAGFSAPEIAHQLDLNRVTVWKWLKEISPENHEFNRRKAQLADQLAITTLDNLNLSAKMTKHLAQLPDEALMEMNPVNVAAIKRTADVGYGIAHDHYRLESEKSTSNQSVIIRMIQESQAEIWGQRPGAGVGDSVGGKGGAGVQAHGIKGEQGLEPVA